MENEEFRIVDLSITDKDDDEIPAAEFLELVEKRAPYYRLKVSRVSPLNVKIEGENIRLLRFIAKMLDVKKPLWQKKVGHFKSEEDGN
ncbi:MAG: hypothetical protein WC302_00150 [Candidatus Paceibacterota bacterium]|jgi:hypothetical protein